MTIDQHILLCPWLVAFVQQGNKSSVTCVGPAIHNAHFSFNYKFKFSGWFSEEGQCVLLFSEPVASSLPGAPASCLGSQAGLCHAARCPSWCPHKAAPGLLTRKAAHNSLPLQGSNRTLQDVSSAFPALFWYGSLDENGFVFNSLKKNKQIWKQLRI